LAKKKKTEKPRREYTRRQISQLRRQRRRQRIIFIGGITVVAAVVIIVLAGWLVGEYMPMHRTVLKVNDAEFDMSYYIDTLEMAVANQGTSQINMLAGSAAQQIIQNEFIRQAAEKLDITVSNEEIKEMLKRMDIPVTDGAMGLMGAEMVKSRLKSDYFGPQVPQSDEQVYLKAMLVESERVAREVAERLQNSENFTALAEEFAQNYYSKNINQGDFGWHPRSIYEYQLNSDMAIDYAFSAEVGSLSDPLYDEGAYKQVGYWLLKVNDRPDEETANVSALLIGSQELAEDIKERLEAGEELGPIADEYTNYTLSKEGHGELGLVHISEEVSEPFDNYVYNPDTMLGEWSDPIFDDSYWSEGGYWVIEVVGREEDRKISSEDRNYLIEQLYNEWLMGVTSNVENIVDDTNLDEESRQWAIDRVLKKFPEAEGQ
jgi:parvulin-like peptidyl-prolyl isomerase